MRLLKDLIVTVFGGCTSILTALILFVADGFFGVSLYGFTVFFIVPVGAMISGFVAALGYYFGARLIGHRPSALLLLNMLIVSVLTYFLVHFLTYAALWAANDPFVQQRSFLGYLDAGIRESSMVIHSRSSQSTETGKLGMWGYGIAALQVLGFAIGGLGVFGMLAMIPFCDHCSRYVSKVGSQTRFFADPEAFHGSSAEIVRLCAARQFQEALDFHAAYGEVKAKGCKMCTTIKLRQCRGCDVYWVGFAAQVHNNNAWADVPGSAFHHLHDGELALNE
jgi:hypothetical protein